MGDKRVAKRKSMDLVPVEPTSIMKSYRNASNETIYHDPEHTRCHGTGFLIEHYVTATPTGEVWKNRAWDCDCRNPIDIRPNFDRDNPRLRGMTQDDLDEAEYKYRYTDEEKAKMASDLAQVMALPPSKRFGKILEIVKPFPREVPTPKVID